MPCPFTGPKMFCAGPNFLSQPKNLLTYCASHKHFDPDKKMICIQQNWFLWRHKSFWRGTKCSQIFGLAQKIWTGTKHFGTCKRTRHYCPKIYTMPWGSRLACRASNKIEMNFSLSLSIYWINLSSNIPIFGIFITFSSHGFTHYQSPNPNIYELFESMGLFWQQSSDK